jgi:predicted transcriptional regulator
MTAMGTVTIRLDEKADKELSRLAKRLGKSRSEVVRDAIRGFETRARLDLIRRELLPKAEALGWLTDEDVFRDVS